MRSAALFEPQVMSFYARVFASLMVVAAAADAADDSRQLVELPGPMQVHMMANMRDHLATIETVTRLLSASEYGAAADAAESRLGMSSLQAHGAEHMAPFMPEQMRAIGSEMHAAASRFAVLARDAELTGDPAPALEGLAQVMAQCVACHSEFRVH